MNGAQPMWLGQPGRELFAILEPARTTPRAGVLVCAPLLHEHIRSYRLFALLARSLSELGCTVLRFDYHGTGDSTGDDGELTLEHAQSDAALALDALSAQVRELPLVVLGVRAGAFVAAALARQRAQVSALWLWQPIADGEAHVQALHAHDRDERVSHHRFPLQPAAPEESVLMGFPVAPALLAQLRASRLAAQGLPRTIELGAPGSQRTLASAAAIELPTVLADWAGQLEISGTFPPAAVRTVAAALVRTLDEAVPA